MPPIHFALASKGDLVGLDRLSIVASALQRQLTFDFSPIWFRAAVISAYPISDMPDDRIAIVVQDWLDDPAADGLHYFPDGGLPYALVRYAADERWSIAASHEMLEIAIDPAGDEHVAGPSPRPDHGTVRFVQEICDPCQDPRFAYDIETVQVSDFCTPRFYGLPQASDGAARGRYDFHGRIGAPFQVLTGGYLSWITDDGHLWQANNTGGAALAFSDLGHAADRGFLAMREYVDSLTPDRHGQLHGPARSSGRSRAYASLGDRLLAEAERRFGSGAKT